MGAMRHAGKEEWGGKGEFRVQRGTRTMPFTYLLFSSGCMLLITLGGCVDGARARTCAPCITAVRGNEILMRLRGGGNALGVDGEAITEEQAGEELIKAATENNVEGLDPAGINLLVQSGAPVNYQDMWKRTPLHYAAREGHINAISRLVELGADLTAVDFLARTPLHHAARKGHANAVAVLAQLGSDLNHPDKNPWPNNSGRSPMHWACYKGHAEVVYKLCELGANKEARDQMQRTPLHWAARRGQFECVQVLLVMKADVHAIDSKNLKPLNLANSKESNVETQAMLHAATIRGTLPQNLPIFKEAQQPAVPPKPIQQTMAAKQAPKPQTIPTPSTTSKVPSANAGRSRLTTEEKIELAGSNHDSATSFKEDTLAAAVAKAQARYAAGSKSEEKGGIKLSDDDETLAAREEEVESWHEESEEVEYA
uniref:Uncharacterized protein n=2 Tax=Guillardia theta TaxID=55529 RepID=A0A7S4KMR5_GUITH|mmetsp:Transcript_27533/g.89675  ORF Transcript_27533/g.89675 Transcript_27533/m.89675 type:complete len:427 (+) Transcript_27533:32-1312(+)